MPIVTERNYPTRLSRMANYGGAGFGAQSVLFALMSMVTGVFNLAFNVLGARWLGPASYGALVSVLAASNIMLSFNSAVTMGTSSLGSFPTIEEWLWVAKVARVLLVGTVVLWACTMPITALVTRFLHVGNESLLFVIAMVMVLPGYMGALNMGIIQGHQRFVVAGGINIGSAVIKLGVFGLVIIFDRNAIGGVLGVFAGIICVWLVSAMYTRKLRQRMGTPNNAGEQRSATSNRLFFQVIILSIGGIVFFNFDLLVARHFLSVAQSGVFAGLGLSGRIILFCTAPFAAVMYPYIVKVVDSRKRKQRLFWTVGITSALG